MAWWSGKVSLGGLQDIAGAVNKISESVKNIEKNFDSALGLEEKHDDEEASGSRTSNSGFFNPVMAFMGHNGEEDSTEVSEKPQSTKNLSAEEENHSTPTKKQISEVDPSEVSGTSPKQASKSEEAHSISNESPVSKADVSGQSMTPQTPTHPSVAEEKIDGSTEAPASKVGDAEAPETSQSPGHPSTVEENQDHQDSKHSGPSDEAEPNQLRESAGDLPDVSASSPTKIDKSGDTETGESIHTGEEDTSDGNTSQSQPTESTLASSDNITEAGDKIAQVASDWIHLDSAKGGASTEETTTTASLSSVGLSLPCNDSNRNPYRLTLLHWANSDSQPECCLLRHETVSQSLKNSNKNDKLQRWLFVMVWLMGEGATRELIFRSIYYMLNNVVNLVKYGVFILLPVVIFF